MLGIFGICFSNIKVFCQNNVFFELLQQKPCRIIYEFRQNTISGPETCKTGPKLWLRSCPDLSRRTSTYCKPAEILLFSRITPFHFSFTNLSCFLTSVLLNKFIILIELCAFIKQIYYFYKLWTSIKQIYHFYKIMCFSKQIHEDKSLSQSHIFTFIFWFYASYLD